MIPKNCITEDAILQLMAIYRKQALDVSDAESAQRALRRLAKTQRVQTEQGTLLTEQEIAINEQNANEQRVPTAQVDMSPDLGIFKFEQPSNSNHIETRDAMHHPQFITPFITQDDCDSPPSSNTHQRRKGTCWRSSISVLVLILTLVSTSRGRRIRLASKIPFYLL